MKTRFLMLRALMGAAFCMIVCCWSACGPIENAQEDDRVQLRIGQTPIMVDVADTPEELSTGYFGRQAPADGEGILFVLARPDVHSFIMSDGGRSVDFELGIAFVNPGGRITGVSRLLPEDPRPVNSPPNTLFAIEGSWTFFQAAPVEVGMTVHGLPSSDLKRPASGDDNSF